MLRRCNSAEGIEFFSFPMAKWVIGVLGMLIAVVGQEGLLGLILRQTRSEIASLIRDQQRTTNWPGEKWFLNN